MKKLWMIMILCICLTMGTAAQEESDSFLREQYRDSGLEQTFDSLDDSTREMLERWGIDPSGIFGGEGLNIHGVWEVVWELLTACVKNPLSAGAAGMGVMLLCSFARTVLPERSTGMNGVMLYFSTLCIAAAVLIPAGYTLSKAASAIAALGHFMLAFIPVFAGILIGMGRSLTAGGACSLVFGCSQLLVWLSQSLLVPLIGMFLAMAICEATVTDLHTAGWTAAFKRCAGWILGLSTTVFSALLCLTGVINGAGDSIAQRTSRFLIGNMVPVIGGTLSESLGMVQGCFSLLKTGGGVLGIGAVLAILLPVLLEVLLWRGMLALLTAASQVTGAVGVTRIFQSLCDGMGLLLAVMICCLVVYTVSLSVLMLAGGSAA